MDTKKLIEEVLLDLGNNKSLKDVSTKIQIIVRLLGNDELKEWYNNEFITGYKGKNILIIEFHRQLTLRLHISYLKDFVFGNSPSKVYLY